MSYRTPSPRSKAIHRLSGDQRGYRVVAGIKAWHGNSTHVGTVERGRDQLNTPVPTRLKHANRPLLLTSPPPMLAMTRRGEPPSAGMLQMVPCASPGSASRRSSGRELASGDQRGSW